MEIEITASYDIERIRVNKTTYKYSILGEEWIMVKDGGNRWTYHIYHNSIRVLSIKAGGLFLAEQQLKIEITSIIHKKILNGKL